MVSYLRFLADFTGLLGGRVKNELKIIEHNRPSRKKPAEGSRQTAGPKGKRWPSSSLNLG